MDRKGLTCTLPGAFSLHGLPLQDLLVSILCTSATCPGLVYVSCGLALSALHLAQGFIFLARLSSFLRYIDMQHRKAEEHI